MTRRATYLAIATALLATVARCEPVRWFNVEVNEARHDTEVRLHLPMSLVIGVLDEVDTAELRHGKVHVACHSGDVDWRALLSKLRTAPEQQSFTVADRGTDVVVTRAGATVQLRFNPRSTGGEEARVDVAANLLDALEVSDAGDLDVRALVARLGTSTGEVLKVESPDANVRIWVE